VLCLPEQGRQDKLLEEHRADKLPTERRKDKFIGLEIPSSVHQFRQLYYDSKFSIESNLPKPTILRAGEYCFVRITDCIANLLAHGAAVDNLLEDDNFPSNNKGDRLSFRESPHVQSLKDRWEEKIHPSKRKDVIMLWISWWADAFEPNSSNKQNRLSVWIKTVTISQPTNVNGNDITNTFPIAMGPKNGDKDGVEAAIMKDLDALSMDKVKSIFDLPRMFDKRSGEWKYVCAKVVVCIHDQIDRRGVLNLAFGNGKYHGMFGWSYDFGKKYASVVACDECHKSMLSEKYYFGDPTARTYRWRDASQCKSCSAWFYHTAHDTLSYAIPQELSACFDGGRMQPIELTFNLLQQSLTLAHQRFVRQKWNVSQTTAFLKMHCLSTELIDRFMEHANACIAKAANEMSLEDIGLNVPLMLEDEDEHNGVDPNVVEDIGSDEERARQAIERAIAANPALFDRIKTPPLWRGNISLDSYVEAPMHLMFLGIVESTIKLVHEWLSRRRQLTMFLEYADLVMPEIIALNLPWCKLLAYGTSGKFGGWVSENYLAFSRLFKWFYYKSIKSLPDHNRLFCIPSEPVISWTMTQCEQFILEYGVVCDGTSAADKRRAIEKRREELYRDNLPKRRATRENVLDMINTLADMLEFAMDDQITRAGILHLEVRIRLFLQAVHKFDIGFNKYPMGHDKYTPVWVTKYNFLSLLKLPDTIRQFGPLRGFWEGGAIGEGFLRSIKPDIQRGLRYNWQNWILNNFLDKKAFDMVSRKFDEPHSDVKPSVSSYGCKIHLTAAIAIRKFYSGVPVSFIATPQQGFGLLYRSVKNIRIIRLRAEKLNSIVNGLAYFRFSLNDEGDHPVFSNNPCESQDVLGGLLLPAVDLNGFESANRNLGHHNSTAIFSNWSYYTASNAPLYAPEYHCTS
jgi:hypothetical protein